MQKCKNAKCKFRSGGFGVLAVIEMEMGRWVLVCTYHWLIGSLAFGLFFLPVFTPYYFVIYGYLVTLQFRCLFISVSLHLTLSSSFHVNIFFLLG